MRKSTARGMRLGDTGVVYHLRGDLARRFRKALSVRVHVERERTYSVALSAIPRLYKTLHPREGTLRIGAFNLRMKPRALRRRLYLYLPAEERLALRVVLDLDTGHTLLSQKIRISDSEQLEGIRMLRVQEAERLTQDRAIVPFVKLKRKTLYSVDDAPELSISFDAVIPADPTAGLIPVKAFAHLEVEDACPAGKSIAFDWMVEALESGPARLQRTTASKLMLVAEALAREGVSLSGENWLVRDIAHNFRRDLDEILPRHPALAALCRL
jgi:hypothetical protein